MVVTCEISFDNNRHGTFYAGQLVGGCVTLKSDKPKEVQAILLKVVGYSITKWSEKSLGSTKQYAGREDYLSSNTYLLGSEQNNNRHIIQAGVHNYNFSCQLPYQCPSSFEGRYGCIRYIVKVLLIRPWKYDQAYTTGFTVLKMMDLNFETPQLRLAAHSEGYRTFCCGPCKTDPLKLELNLPQAGYVPGQKIPVTVVVVNNSSVAVSELRLSLVMLIRYFSLSPDHARVERIIISRAKGDAVLKQCTRSLTIDLPVPSTPPTCVELSNLIQIAYQVEVEALVKSLREEQLMIMPVTIGTMPLAVSGIVVQQPPRRSARYDSPADELPVVTALGSVPNDLTPREGDTFAPKYEESRHTPRGNINEEEIHAFGINEFAPLYPVYSIPSPTPTSSANAGNAGIVNQSYEK
ncbi:arrestin domain-containing protein 17 [Drosophila guanche]|uniref:Blast:Arrestin domain-containing protein 3 n=1 Tax=Drosophila guanche TaxID=7266 RepID=A0A3B0JPD9_DROGU|nr:arrestin domain-containing protein 17 [Drosophila guanche]SPP84084.1 blast:Arrestin domain-containing protein 3 [Drosophila guanche]